MNFLLVFYHFSMSVYLFKIIKNNIINIENIAQITAFQDSGRCNLSATNYEALPLVPSTGFLGQRLNSQSYGLCYLGKVISNCTGFLVG